MGMQALPTGVYGPLPPETVGLLLGRSSTTMKGLHVAPGVIDADYTGEIKVMTHSPQGISVIPSGQRIAQLILLPIISVGRTVTTSPRKDGGFGSSEAYWIQEIKQNRPQLELKIQGKWFKGILDTGADVSCIADIHWPSAWPSQQTLTELQGIGQSQSPLQSSDILTWEDSEGHIGTFQPYIVPRLPINLWGRDVMSEMGVYLYSPSAQVSQQMFNQGLLPQQGLGSNNQGIVEPLPLALKQDRRGLGYFPQGP